MRKLISLFMVLFLSSLVFGQTWVVEDFEEPADSTHWEFEKADNSDSTAKSDLTFQNTNSVEGNAMTIDWRTQNSESWGGYVKTEHIAPDSMVYDWSAYDSISFYFYTDMPQTDVGRTHLRFELYEVSDVPDTTSGAGDMEFYYSFHYNVCDDSSASWIKITMPLEADGNYWDGEGFNRTGWAGVTGNDKLDKDKIKGYAFEFSMSGGGEGDYSEGMVTLDQIYLHGLAPNPWLIFNGKSLDPTFTQFTWGQSTMEIVEGGGIDPKTNALLWTQGDEWANGWSGAGWNVDPVKDLAFRWDVDSVRLAVKTEGEVGTLRLQFESGENGKVGLNFDPVNDGAWHEYALALKDVFEVDGTTEFDPSMISVVQLMGEGNAVAGNKIYFDFIWTGDPVIDVVPPVAPTGVAAVPGTYVNLVTWIDVPGEDESVYNVLFSDKPITSIDDDGLDIVARNVAPGTQLASHVLTAPLVDKELTYYYAVYAVDAAGNDGELAGTESVTNMAEGIATIAYNLTGFAADGNLAEWSEIMPIRMYPSDNSGTIVNNTTIDGDADLSLDAWVAVDDTYLYFAADVEDDVIDIDSTDGETWMRDGVDLFVGLYDQRGAKHTSYKRGAEPDYHFRFSKHQLLLDITGGGVLTLQPGDYYWQEDFPTGYTVEGRVSLDTLAAKGGDERFHPVVGMKIPIDYSINDADGARREGILTLAQANQDQSWGDPSRWVHTWIGDQMVDVAENSMTINTYELGQNYPNPFNPSTVINYSLATSGMVSLKVFNVLGQEVLTLVEQNQNAGQYQIKFDASQLTSGVYIYRIQSGSFVSSKKMMLLK